MKRAFLGAAAGFALNVAAVMIVPLYRDLIIDLGGQFVRDTDIADIPAMALVGFVLASVAWILLGVGVERIVHSRTLLRHVHEMFDRR